MKSALIRIFSDSYFPAFGLNAERHGVFSPNARKYGPVMVGQQKIDGTKNYFIKTFTFK